MALHRATVAEIDLNAFRQNFELLKSHIHSKVKIMAVVKADGYGHGALPCARAAIAAGTDFLGVGILEEGIELRQNGIQAPILVMGGVLPNEVKDLIHYNLSSTIYDHNQLDALTREATRANQIVSIHLKIDTGMSRLGVLPENFFRMVEKIIQNKSLSLDGLCTHLSSADEVDETYTRIQLDRLENTLSEMKKAGYSIPPVHCANSAAILHYSQCWKDIVRPGLLLYGVLPSPNLKSFAEAFTLNSETGFQPVMQLKSKIIQINPHPKGTPVSYGRRHILQRDSLIATIPIGYADGLTRHLSDKLEVLVRGRRISQIGTICMDLCLIDVTDIANVELADEVVIFGRQGETFIPVEEVADRAGLIPYETLCAVGKRVPRIYFDQE